MKTPKPVERLLARWRASASLRFGKQMVDGLFQRCRAPWAVVRQRVALRVNTAPAAVDAVVSAMRRAFGDLRGRAFVPGSDDSIAKAALWSQAGGDRPSGGFRSQPRSTSLTGLRRPAARRR
ncbi:hypothetical protein AB0A69_27390 [Streptomyces sp. NPDC045431]|uniref:hypothetical protein n=1 Tax=Streptomyces sp. NPDC045431 TaxID=3155613 RepID=UPI0033C370E1